MTIKVSKNEITKPIDMNLTSEIGTVEYDCLILGDFSIEFDISFTGGYADGNFEIQGGSTPATVLEFTPEGEIRTREGHIHVANYGGQSVRIRVDYFINKRLFDIYADGKLIASDYSADIFTKLHHITVIFDKCITFTFDMKSASDDVKMHIRNVSAKQIGNAPVWEKEIIPTTEVWYLDETNEKEFMKDKVSLHLRSGLLCKNGKKIPLSQKSFVKDEKIMVPTEFFSLAYDECENSLDKFESENIDGVTYYNLQDVANSLLLKKVFYDNTSVHSGLVILSDEEISFDDKDKLQKLNDYCFYERPTPEKWLSDYNKSPLKGVHPRIIATEDDFARIREEVKTNEYKKRWYKNLLENCEEIMTYPTLKYEVRDRVRLMYVADDFMVWMTCLAFAYKLTGDKKYFDAAWKQIEAVSQMPDWNPIHHIDVGIMALGYAIAYDWFYELLSDNQRSIMEKCVHNNLYWIINEAHKRPDSPYGDPGMDDNHNTFCNAGVIACCVAFMDAHPEIGSSIASNTIKVLERYMRLFAPYGAYFEGPGYAAIGINYCVRLFASMEPTMGTLYSLDKAEAFDRSSDYITNTESDALSFNFADNGPEPRTCMASLWLYNHYGIKGKKEHIAEFFKDYAGLESVYCTLFYNVEKEDMTDVKEVLDVYYPGEEIITMRNHFNPGQVFVGIKAGDTLYVHSHLDCGSFVYDALGRRWAHDLGADDYNLEYNWGFYEIFRRRPESHNTLIIDPDGEEGFVLGARADILSYDSKPDGIIVKIDMTSLYGDKVTDAKRGFFFTDKRQSLVVRDEVALTGKSSLYWMMFIDSDYEIIDSDTVILKDPENPSKKIMVEFVSDGGEGRVYVEAPVPFPTSPQIPEQDKNEGFHKLYYRLDSSSENVTITAKITPVGIDDCKSEINSYCKPMAEWNL